MRLDAALVDRGLADDVERARALISAGLVEVGERRATASDQKVSEKDGVRIVGRDHPWASRAGLKLDSALDDFGVDCRDRVALDAGASTGGFVSVLLARGARCVYAVDVGRGQLLTSLANDPRVRVLDETNIRTLDALDGEPPSLITLDLSFISLRAVVPNLARLAPGAEVVALFKPQFEVAREGVGEGGIVRDRAVAQAALADLIEWLQTTEGHAVLHDPVPAAVKGTKGNQEWLIHIQLANAHD